MFVAKNKEHAVFYVAIPVVFVGIHFVSFTGTYRDITNIKIYVSLRPNYS